MMSFFSASSYRKLLLWTAKIFLLIACFGGLLLSTSFPQGAPSDVCESFSPQRGHKTGPRPLEQCPYRLLQYGRHFRPGQLIGVEIITLDESGNEVASDNSSNSTAAFSGFLVQALEPRTLHFIGHFLPGEGLHLMPECSAVTHRNAKLKAAVGLLWRAPQSLGKSKNIGEVIFRATIVESKMVYYQNLLAQVITGDDDDDRHNLVENE